MIKHSLRWFFLLPLLWILSITPALGLVSTYTFMNYTLNPNVSNFFYCTSNTFAPDVVITILSDRFYIAKASYVTPVDSAILNEYSFLVTPIYPNISTGDITLQVQYNDPGSKINISCNSGTGGRSPIMSWPNG